MTEKERLQVAKERIEFVLKTYNVQLFGVDDDEKCLYEVYLLAKGGDKVMEINNV